MPSIRFIFADQLSMSLSALEGASADDVILICEVKAEATEVKHHQKKIAFLFSAMRHFKLALEAKCLRVDYVTLDDPDNTHSFTTELKRALKRHKANKVIVTEPGEYRVLEMIEVWRAFCDVDLREDTRFMASREDFKAWAGDKKQLRMEFFYRTMRKRYHILMDEDNQPVGGQWNYDAANRKPPKKGLSVPEPKWFASDAITDDVMQLVQTHFGDHFGALEPFYFAVTAEQAQVVLTHFIENRLSLFGDYQDAMLENEPWMFHAHISFYLNCGLLLPKDCIEQALKAYEKGLAPLNAVEGFIRQVLGWREFIRGLYWLKMPSYADENFFQADRPLPAFFWTGETKMNCLSQSISQTQQFAYAHHIQRLMVIGNFALLAGLDPLEVQQWYLIVYADAFDWVELPNVVGMILFADGGFLASKPYAASGAYIHKMSNYCANCHYNVKDKNGDTACPFNYLYWDFLIRHRDKLEHNQRMRMIYSTLNRMTPEKVRKIQADAKRFLAKSASDKELNIY